MARPNELGSGAVHYTEGVSLIHFGSPAPATPVVVDDCGFAG